MGAFSFEFYNNNQERGKLTIDQRTLVFEFLPNKDDKKNLNAELKKAADNRDRFNFLISLYLSPFIANKLHYDELLNEEHPFASSENPQSFKVILKFKNNIDVGLMRSIIGDQSPIPFCDLSKFISKESYNNLQSAYSGYFSEQPIALKPRPMGIYACLERACEHAKSLREHSRILLLDNMFKKQENLIFANLSDQKSVVEQLQALDLPDQHLYEDIYLVDKGIAEKNDGVEYNPIYLSNDYAKNPNKLFIAKPKEEKNDTIMNLMARHFFG